MADIVHFVPRHERSVEENLAEFIRVCRDELTVFGAGLDWSANYWPSAGISFGNLDQRTRKLRPANRFLQPFMEFAKAYIRYQQGHRPTSALIEMRALKCLERALVDRGGEVALSQVNGAVFDRAAVLARGYFSVGMAYHAGRELERLCQFLGEKHLTSTRLNWKNPHQRPADTVRTGRKALKERERKLPAEDVLDALADIFSMDPRAPRDIFTTCVTATLLCAPSRVSEVLSLREDCEVWETKRDGTRAYGWRFQPGKGGAPMIKWVPDAMATVAQEAVRRIRVMSAEARRIAAWLEENPNTFYRHVACPQVLEDAPLAAHQVAAALGMVFDTESRVWVELRRFQVPVTEGNISLAGLNRWLRGRLPEDFPWYDKLRGLKYSDALFCLQAKQLRSDMPASPCMVWKPTVNVFNNDLGPRELGGGHVSRSIFDRHGYNKGREHPLKATSHQFRHLLNTMAQRGGLSQSAIARWSGRTDVKQNRVYDHMSEFELVDMLRSHDIGLTLDRPLQEIADHITQQLPITRQEFNTLSMPTAHVTEYGFCVHDFVMSPCQKFRDCLNCSEQVCIKGDARLARIRVRHEQVKQLLLRAEQEIAQGSAGSDRWYEIHLLTEKRLRGLIAILEDTSLQDGTIVRLRNEHEFSPLRRAVEAKAGAGVLHEGEQLLLNELRGFVERVDGEAP